MDILTIADLLNEFISVNKEMLNQHKIKDTVTIGTMYEGLTESVLQKSIFEGLNLKIVKNSFIEGCNNEFDVMLVEGLGEKLPFADRYIYKPEQVIVVIQVKKNLYSKGIEKGYNNLKFLLDYYQTRSLNNHEIKIFSDSFKAICQKELSAKKAGLLTENEEVIFETLKIEAKMPVRIIWGYNGFTSEYNFRKSFLDYLNGNLTIDEKNIKGGFGPQNFPNLIICGKYSMIKNNGMPYGHPVQKDKWWNFYTSSSYNPTNFFLEIIWTRLTYRFQSIPMDIFGEDLIIEPHSRFLDCHIKKLNEYLGWEYKFFEMSNEFLTNNTEVTEWQPAILDSIQYTIICELCKYEEINLLTEKELESFVKEGGYINTDNFIAELKKTGIVYVLENKLRLLTDECSCAILPDGRYVAGENKSGRLKNWIDKEVDRLKQEKKS